MAEIGVPKASPLVTVRNVDIVAAGTWDLSTGEATFTAADLAHAVEASQCPAVGLPVIKLGHVDPRFDGEPGLGRVANMRLAAGGTKITADLAGMPGWLGDVMASAYPNRSIEGAWDFTCQIGHVHPFVITALALLGTAAPGVGVLGDISDVAGLYGVKAAAGRKGDTMPRRHTGDDIGAEQVKTMYAAHKAIMAAARRGAISPAGALRWARGAVRGEDTSILAQMAAAPGVADDYRKQFAATPSLASQVLDILTQILDAMPAGEPVPDEWATLFPPGTYEQPNTMTGPGHYPAVRPTHVYDGDTQGQPNQQPREVSWDGYVSASAGSDDDYSVEELHRELFGDGYFGG